MSYADLYSNDNLKMELPLSQLAQIQNSNRSRPGAGSYRSHCSQHSYDSDAFFKNAPADGAFHKMNRQNSSQHDSAYSALNSSNSSWNEEIFQNALADVLSNSSHESIGEAKGSPAKCSESPPTSLTKTTDSEPVFALERSKSYNGGVDLSFSSLNKSECSYHQEISWQMERASDHAPKKQPQFWFAPQAPDSASANDEDHPIFRIGGENFESKIDFEAGFAPF